MKQLKFPARQTGHVLVALTALLLAVAPVVRAEVDVQISIRTENDFYEPLRPYGRWEVVGSYGRCWVPGVEAGWSPYSNGYWQESDAGWYWASNEPWGWATYHYGRWDLDDQLGWYWVPQTEWAPAWVSWRSGGGYIGWAPMGPRGRGVVEISGGRGYVFVEERRFMEPVRNKTVVVNTVILNKTVNITKTRIVNKTVINEGPEAAVVEKASGHKMQAVQVRELRHKEEAPVIAKHPVLAPPCIRTEPIGRDPKVADKPAVITHDAPPATPKEIRQTETPPREQPATPREIRQADVPLREQPGNARPAPARETAKPEAEHRAEVPEQKAPKAVEKRAEQQEKRAEKSEAREERNPKGGEQQQGPGEK